VPNKGFLRGCELIIRDGAAKHYIFKFNIKFIFYENTPLKFQKDSNVVLKLLNLLLIATWLIKVEVLEFCNHDEVKKYF